MKNNLSKFLEGVRQGHLLTFWEELTDAEHAVLGTAINTIDFEKLASLYEHCNNPSEAVLRIDHAVDPPYHRLSDCDQALADLGEDPFRKGKVGVILTAGGRGTRLGFPHPKGMFPIDPVNGTTLFQIHFEKVVTLSKRYGCRIPYCIMTSHVTHNETADFLKQSRYFGLREKDVLLFCQDSMPVVSINNGKTVLERKGNIACSPDGHGGMVSAIAKSGYNNGSVLDQLRERGIEFLFAHQVSNPLTPICPPEFLGCHIANRSDMTVQVIRKRSAQDRLGTIFSDGSRLHAVEYCDIPNEAAERRKQDGLLQFWAGNIGVYLFNIEFLERLRKHQLPFHAVRKKLPLIDIITGQLSVPTKENVIQFERFLFDLLPFAENATIAEVDPETHHAPLKNATGQHSPETVRQRLLKQGISQDIAHDKNV